MTDADRKLIGPPHAHLDRPCTDACYEPVGARDEAGFLRLKGTATGDNQLDPERPTTTVADPYPESMCHRCAGPNRPWSAPSPLWNEVMRGGSINGTEIFHGIVCPTCFMILAEENGIADLWHLYPRRVHVELETVTPSGRVWDETTWMFVEPDTEQEHARAVARELLAIVAAAIRRDASLVPDDDRLILADAFEAAVPLVGNPVARPVVLPLAKLAQRMYAAGTAVPAKLCPRIAHESGAVLACMLDHEPGCSATSHANPAHDATWGEDDDRIVAGGDR